MDAGAITENAKSLGERRSMRRGCERVETEQGRFPQSLGKRFAFPTSAHRPLLIYTRKSYSFGVRKGALI